MITCETCQYADSKTYGKPELPFCFIKKHHVTPTVDREDCKHYLESPKSYWERKKGKPK